MSSLTAQSHPIEGLYRSTGHLVFRRCYQMLGNAEEAMELTQETYLRAFEIGFEVRSQPEAMSWLYQTATLRCLAYLRDEGNRRRLRERNLLALVGPPVPSPEQRALSRQLLNRLLSQLDERSAQVVLLHWMQGMSPERTAEMLEVSVRTVYRARRRAEEVLETLLEPGKVLP